METLSITDKIAIALFVFGLAFALTTRFNSYLITSPANSIADNIPEKEIVLTQTPS